MDNIMGIITSLWIIYTGYTIISESYSVLIDESIDLETKDKIVNIIIKNEKIEK